MNHPLELGVKQFIAVVQGDPPCGSRFMVFETGSAKHYLFAQLDNDGCMTGLQFPVEKKRLRDNVRRALAHGFGNANIVLPRQSQ